MNKVMANQYDVTFICDEEISRSTNAIFYARAPRKCSNGPIL